MIIHEKLEKPYEELAIRKKVWLFCDYCGKEFQRDKKSRERLNSVIKKDSCGGKECKKLKINEVNVEKFGVPNFFESEKFKKQNKEICLERYGTENYYSSDDFKTKREIALQQKYGVTSPLRSKIVQERQEQTMLEKHGVKNAMQAEKFKDKAKQTSLQNHGVEYPMQSENVKITRDNTNLNKYGVKSFVQTEEYWEKRRHSTITKRGCEHTSQDPEVRKKYQNTIFQKYNGANSLSEVPEILDKIEKTMMERYGVPSALCLPENRQYGKTQTEIKDWLNSFGFNFESDYQILDGKELDLYEPTLNLAIEYCGLYWHNEMSKTPRLRRYHYDKYLKCTEKNVRLITIFEDEWKQRNEPCKNFIKSLICKCSQKVYARNCVIKNISLEEHKIFCNQHHILGSNRLSVIAFGIYYKDELLGTVSLGRHHRGLKDIVLDRLCFKNNFSVIGGASKLFKECIIWAKNHGHNKILSWSDNRWSAGKVYQKLNFVLEKEYGPDYSYVDIAKPYERISKQSKKKKQFSLLTEKQLCLEQGLARIWDCGKKKWIFNII